MSPMAGFELKRRAYPEATIYSLEGRVSSGCVRVQKRKRPDQNWRMEYGVDLTWVVL